MKKKIAIIGGAGHIGLPLAFLLAQNKHEVVCVDNNIKSIELINKGHSPFEEFGFSSLIKKIKKLPIKFTEDLRYISSCDIIFVTLGTPVDEYLNPNFKLLFQNLTPIFKYLKNNQTLILRSTVSPGSSRRIYSYIKKFKKNINLAYCPERIAQGFFFKEIYKIPQLVSGINSKSVKICENFFQDLGIETVNCKFEEAEIAKLMCNSWRYLKFAIANQFYTICEDNKMDYNKIRKLMNYKYDRAKDLPKSGFAAGPCLLKDTMQLAAFSRNLFTMGHNAMIANETLPDFIVNNLKKTHKLLNINIGILGMTFKPNNDDIRDSLAFKLKKKLEYEGSNIYCSDPYHKDINFVDQKILLQKCTIIFIGCPHDIYKKIKFKKNIKIVDCWDFVRK
jgi:UDP-N-acetyl-D-mannosaminuronic acid dehydrogenase